MKYALWLLPSLLWMAAPPAAAKPDDPAPQLSPTEQAAQNLQSLQQSQRKAAEAVSGAAAGIGALAVVLLALISSVALCLACAATWPDRLTNSADWAATRPWLCFGWGVPLMLIAAMVAGAAQGAGGPGGLVALLIVGGLCLALVHGFAALATLLGERLADLRGAGTGNRLASTAVGALVLTAALLTPIGWVALLFVLPCAVGAARFGRTPVAVAPAPPVDLRA